MSAAVVVLYVVLVAAAAAVVAAAIAAVVASILPAGQQASGVFAARVLGFVFAPADVAGIAAVAVPGDPSGPAASDRRALDLRRIVLWLPLCQHH